MQIVFNFPKTCKFCAFHVKYVKMFTHYQSVDILIPNYFKSTIRNMHQHKNQALCLLSIVTKIINIIQILQKYLFNIYFDKYSHFC